jgi:RimJ/RimL family protein N-acetyltransferase
MEQFLIFIKHHLTFLWRIIEWSNGMLFLLFYKKRMTHILDQVFKEFGLPPFFYKKINTSNIIPLHNLINVQEPVDLEYFHPHGLDQKSLFNQLHNHSLLMMGVFDRDRIIGYFFLRFFINKKCFVGRLIDKEYRGKGIGEVMNKIMYETAWRNGFRCFSTISKNNEAVMRAHSKNNTMTVIKELRNNYILVEFIKDKNVY